MGLWEWFSERAKRLLSELTPPDKVFRTRAILVRVGDYVMLGSPDQRFLTPAGEQQARDAANVIRSLLGDETPVVLDSSDVGAYVEMAEMMASELGVPVTKRSDLRPPPATFQMPAYQAIDGTAVMVLNGSHLGDLLGTLPGPAVEVGFMGPAHGSVHVLEIEWRVGPSTYNLPVEISRRFV